MKETLLQLANYNIWANKRLIEALLKLADEDLDKELISSFPSIKKTLFHTWSAEFIWLQRLQLTEQPVWLEDAFRGSIADACQDWLKVSETLAEFVKRQHDDKVLKHVVQYYDRQKKSHKTPVYQVLLHVFNHSTYHRGQMITMLRQVDATKIPGTDFIGFVRE